MLEKDVKSKVRMVLSQLESCGDLIWYERLQAGVVRQADHYIHLSRPGTPDFIAILMNKKRNISVLFIECKASNVKAEPRKGVQQEFARKYAHKHIDIEYMIAQSGADVRKKILDLAFDRVADIKFEV